jgi:outer membrane lipoprotein LolB
VNKMSWVTARWALAIALLFLAGCASLSKPAAPMPAHGAHWQGRLALKIHSEPVQAFSAYFDLQGDAQAGALTFFTPIGSTAARLEWNPQGAQLQTSGEPQQFASVDALTRHSSKGSMPPRRVGKLTSRALTMEKSWRNDWHLKPQSTLKSRWTVEATG